MRPTRRRSKGFSASGLSAVRYPLLRGFTRFRVPPDSGKRIAGSDIGTTLKSQPIRQRFEPSVVELTDEARLLRVMVGLRDADRGQDPAAIPIADRLPGVEKFVADEVFAALESFHDEIGEHVPVQ